MIRRHAAKVHAELLDRLSDCGMVVLSKPFGGSAIAICWPDPDRYVLSMAEQEALRDALADLGRTLAARKPEVLHS